MQKKVASNKFAIICLCAQFCRLKVTSWQEVLGDVNLKVLSSVTVCEEEWPLDSSFVYGILDKEAEKFRNFFLVTLIREPR